jgi:hypothetical protein
MQIIQIKKEDIALEYIGKDIVYQVIKRHDSDKYHCSFVRIDGISSEQIMFYDGESKEYGVLLHDNPNDFNKYFKYDFEGMWDINWKRKMDYVRYMQTITKEGDFIVF